MVPSQHLVWEGSCSLPGDCTNGLQPCLLGTGSFQGNRILFLAPLTRAVRPPPDFAGEWQGVRLDELSVTGSSLMSQAEPMMRR